MPRGRCLAIHYPVSKATIRVHGYWLGIRSTDGTREHSAPMIELTQATTYNGQRMEPGNYMLIDPRCTVRDPMTDTLIYDPKESYDRLPRWAQEWLTEQEPT
jgi:hypothetical protein